MSEQMIPVSLSAQFKQLRTIIAHSVETGELDKLVLSKYKGTIAGLEKIQMRIVEIKQQSMLCFVYKYKTKDSTKNYSLNDALDEIAAQMNSGFKHLHAHTSTHDYQLMVSKKDKVVLAKTVNAKRQQDSKDQQNLSQQPQFTVKPPQQNQAQQNQSPQSSVVALQVTTNHNRAKHRYVEQSRPFLRKLGVTDAQGQIIPAMSRKWKQINKFLEIFAGALQQAGINEQDQLSVVDFGSGKGYLTFAVHDYIVQQLHQQADVTGVELRDELVKLCNVAAQQVDANGITFYQGDVRSFTPNHVDVMIALHACDVATDYALHTGIRLNAAVIMCAPCCHKEIRPQLKMPSVLKPMLNYGVHLGQQAEMLTDSLRALLLEANGYETKVFEFVALEHTSKNKMILAVKKPFNTQKQNDAMQQVAELKSFYGVEQQSLEQLLSEQN